MAQCRADPTTHHSGRTSSGATDLHRNKAFSLGRARGCRDRDAFLPVHCFCAPIFLKNNLDTGLHESTSNPNPACKHFEAELLWFFLLLPR